MAHEYDDITLNEFYIEPAPTRPDLLPNNLVLYFEYKEGSGGVICEGQEVSAVCAELRRLRSRVIELSNVLTQIALADRYTWEKDGTDIFEAFREMAKNVLYC